MEDQEKIKSALLAVFPTSRHLLDFAEEPMNVEALQALLLLAFRYNLIATAQKDALVRFIRVNSNINNRFASHKDLNFELFLAQKEKLLNVHISTRKLTKQINELLATHKAKLPKVTDSMLSRLKKETADTSHKKNVLRSIAFWIGYNRGHLAGQWNYESLFRICSSLELQAEPGFGVRIGFALSGRGDVIDHNILDWLKKKIKHHLKKTLGQLNYDRWGKIREQDITNLCVDFPKPDPLECPATYRQSLRRAVSLAHQIAVQWALTSYCNQNRFLAIGIAAGKFADLDDYLLTIVKIRLPGDPVIRLTDYARQCALTNDIRISFCSKPKEITLVNGRTLAIWWVMGAWTMLFFDFVPELLQDPLLGSDIKSTGTLYRYLYGIMNNAQYIASEDTANAVTTFLNSPHNFLLGLEIAKTLYYRRRFWDAAHILWFMLNIDPTHLYARSFLIKLFCNLALDAPSQTIADGFFEQAEEEVRFVLKYCDHLSEDFYCEYALLYLSRALVNLSSLRNGALKLNDAAKLEKKKNLILKYLGKSNRLFSRGMLISPLSIRATYLGYIPKIITCILENRDGVFTDPNLPLEGNAELIRDVIKNYQWQFGGLRKDISQGALHKPMKRLFKAYIKNHDDAIALKAYRPATYFCAAVSWWDFFPVRTVENARQSIKLLQKAVDIAQEMDSKGISIYSFAKIYGEMLPAEKFITYMQRSIAMIEEYCGKNLVDRKGDEIIADKDNTRLPLLMTLNFS